MPKQKCKILHIETEISIKTTCPYCFGDQYCIGEADEGKWDERCLSCGKDFIIDVDEYNKENDN